MPKRIQRRPLEVEIRVPLRHVVLIRRWHAIQIGVHRIGQMPARVVVAKQHACNRRPTRLTRIPRIQNRRHMVLRPVHRQRPRIHQHQHRLRIRRIHSLKQSLLRPRQIQIPPVPPLSLDPQVRPQKHHRHIRPLRQLRRPRNRRRIDRLGKARALLILNIHPSAQQLLQPLHRTHLARRRPVVVPGLIGRIARQPNHRNRLHVTLLQRQKAIPITQQRHRLQRRLQRKLQVLRRPNHTSRNLRVRIILRWIERPQPEPNAQHPRQRTVHISHRKLPTLYRQRNVRLKLLIVGVVACLDRPRRRIHRVFRNMVPLNQVVHRPQIIRHESIEPPLAPQNIFQQIFVHRIRGPVDRVVRRHHRLRMALHNRRLPMRQPVLHQVALIHLRRKPLPIRLHVVHREVLHRRRHLQVVRVVPLQPLHISHSHPARQERVFAEHLLNPPPQRIPADVDHRRTKHQPMLRPRPIRRDVVKRASLIPHRSRNRVHQLRVPRRPHRNRRRKQSRRLLRPHAMQRLVPSAPRRNP